MVYLELLRTTAADPKLKRLSLPDRETWFSFKERSVPLSLLLYLSLRNSDFTTFWNRSSKSNFYFCAVPHFQHTNPNVVTIETTAGEFLCVCATQTDKRVPT